MILPAGGCTSLKKMAKEFVQAIDGVVKEDIKGENLNELATKSFVKDEIQATKSFVKDEIHRLELATH